MRILWDFRLFSLGYGSRGVGRWTLASARAIIAAGLRHELTIWGEPQHLPSDVLSWPARWIPYRGGSWRSDLWGIPWLLVRHRIDLIHYWIGLGPLYRIGFGVVHPLCASCATIYDAGVEFWNEIPFLAQRRKTWYWRIQKAVARKLNACVCISQATETDVRSMLPGVRTQTILVPYLDFGDCGTVANRSAAKDSSPFFVSLGGAPNKNLATTLCAFSIVRQRYPQYRLFLCGDINLKEEAPQGVPEGVFFESIDWYRSNLPHATALLICSTREGFGLPLLEAIGAGCPVIAGDIAPLREIGEEAACFVDPHDPLSIARAMEEVAADTNSWRYRSLQMALRYRERSHCSGHRWLELYDRLLSGRRNV